MTQVNMRALNEVKKYAALSVNTDVQDASPHRLIQMLMEGALARIVKARVCIRNRDTQRKGEFIGLAISIIGGLRDSLDHKAGADLAHNLDRLYEYMSTRLLQANMENDLHKLDEVQALLTEIKLAWDAIGQLPPQLQVKAMQADSLQKRAL